MKQNGTRWGTFRNPTNVAKAEATVFMLLTVLYFSRPQISVKMRALMGFIAGAITVHNWCEYDIYDC
jgi:hypothetical protein